MKVRLVPIYFKNGLNKEFNEQVNILKDLLISEADILEPVELGMPLPETDAVVFPVLIGEAYKQIEEIKKIKLPILALTSEFGTVAMWDWEIITFLKSEGLKTFAPYNIELTKLICRTLALKRDLIQTKFLIFQDNPGEAGMQADIFKRFYWWEDSCTQLIEEKFGVKIVKKSFKKLADDAKQISDEEAQNVLDKWEFNTSDMTSRAILSAVKLYIAVKKELEKDESIKGVGINCLNESFYSDTTPCLAWNMLLEEKGILWVCEGDTMSLLTKYIIYKSLEAPIIMSNLYPFLMGMAALKHEKIDKFPDIEEPDNCMLVAHCGYFGLVPKCFSSDWTLKPRALQIVDENATAIDARIPIGHITLAKLHPKFDRLLVIEGSLESYAQYPGSDCRNGGIIRVNNGHKLMDKLYSHHSCIITGHKSVEIELMAKVLDLTTEGNN